MCPFEGWHQATNKCVEEKRGDLQLDTSMCDDGSGFSNGSFPNYNGYPSSGGGGNSSGGGDPPPNDYDGSDPDIHGNGGNIITSPNTGCRGAGCIEIEDPEEEEDPCDKIKNRVENPDYIQIKDDLDGNKNLHYETGYSQNQDGTYNELEPTIPSSPNDNHSLNLPIVDCNSMGATHVHINDYEVLVDDQGDNNAFNDIYREKKIIRMPSARDIIYLLQLVKKTQSDCTDIPMENLYTEMISSSGNYTLKFTGNVNDINLSNYNTSLLKIEYKKYFEQIKNDEKAFLNFLKDEIGVDGIDLYKVSNNGSSIKKKYLKENGRVGSTNC